MIYQPIDDLDYMATFYTPTDDEGDATQARRDLEAVLYG